MVYLGDSMKSFFDGILNRCATEPTLTLAKCLGEIGAIHPKYINGDLTPKQASTLSDQWMIKQGTPWKQQSVKVHCQIQLVTKNFVAALKAAPTPTDQHLIGFAIQEGMVGKRTLCMFHFLQITHILSLDLSVLILLDKTQSSTSKAKAKAKTSLNKDGNEMNPWLRNILEEAEVLSIIEPFWASEYKQVS